MQKSTATYRQNIKNVLTGLGGRFGFGMGTGGIFIIVLWEWGRIRL